MAEHTKDSLNQRAGLVGPVVGGIIIGGVVIKKHAVPSIAPNSDNNGVRGGLDEDKKSWTWNPKR